MDALLQEYSADIKDLYARYKAKQQSWASYRLEYTRILYRYALAASYLSGKDAMQPKTGLGLLAPSLDELNTLATTKDGAWEEFSQLIGLCAIKTIGEFRSRLWQAVLRLFHGGSEANFIASFARSIDRDLTEAWNEGGRSVGVDPDEMTADDLIILDSIISNENDFILNLTGDIEAARQEELDEEKFTSKFGARVDLWANRYTETANRARMHFGAQARFQWQLGKTEDHCATCARLNGIIAFGREWEQARLHPQMPPNPLLECGGWRCDCRFKPTKAKRTARALSTLLNIVMGAKP